MPPEFGPDDTLSPTEAHAWRIIERRLRIDLPVHRIERRAHLRVDRVLRLAIRCVPGGLLLAFLAWYSPELLVAIGSCVAVAGLVTATVRAAALVRPERLHRAGRSPSPREQRPRSGPRVGAEHGRGYDQRRGKRRRYWHR